MAHDTPLRFFVFSYNRGVFLDNCVASIERHAPGYPLTIIDDRSDESDTRDVLQKLAKRHEVLTPPEDTQGHRFGGLYRNMQLAYEGLESPTLMCCLQDDMQVVRDVDTTDVERMNRFFDENENAGFLHHAFMKGANRQRYLDTIRFDVSKEHYRRTAGTQSAGIHFAAVATARSDRLASVGWQFELGEPANSRRAEAHFEPMAYHRDPFAMYLPCVPSHRHRRKTWAIRHGEKITGCGFYPFEPMSAEYRDAFLAREFDVLPIAEDFLETNPVAPIKPWVYSPLQKRWLHWLHRLESRLS